MLIHMCGCECLGCLRKWHKNKLLLQELKELGIIAYKILLIYLSDISQFLLTKIEIIYYTPLLCKKVGKEEKILIF